MEDNASEIEEIIIRDIPEKRKYWFVRTFGGQLFEYYYKGGKVGISGNPVPLELIKNGKHDDVTFSTLQSYILKNVIETQSEATKLANQLIGFYHDVKVGDIVMIPSEDSEYIAFGEINSDIRVQETKQTLVHNEKTEPYPEKIRGVKWLKIMEKSDVVGDLRPLFSSHLGLTNADKYGDFIESNLSTFFYKDEHYFSTLYIDLNDEQELNAFDLNRYLDALTKLYHNFCAENNIEYNEDLYIKIKVQSRGNMIFKLGVGLASVGIVGILMMSITGSDPNLQISQDTKGKYNFTAGLKGNLFKNLAEADKIRQETDAKKRTDSLEAEDKKIEQLIKRKENGLLTAEEKELYLEQLVDTAKKLKIKSVESKEVKLSDVN